LEAVSLRMKVLNLINFTFLYGEGSWPVIVVLWKDDELRRFISVWEVERLYKASDREFVERQWASGETAMQVDQGASLLIPTKNGMGFSGPESDVRGGYCGWGTDCCLLLDDIGYVSQCYPSSYDI
jgi:hypothetical protein